MYTVSIPIYLFCKLYTVTINQRWNAIFILINALYYLCIYSNPMFRYSKNCALGLSQLITKMYSEHCSRASVHVCVSWVVFVLKHNLLTVIRLSITVSNWAIVLCLWRTQQFITNCVRKCLSVHVFMRALACESACTCFNYSVERLFRQIKANTVRSMR